MSLDNMFDRGQLSLEEYAELAPTNSSVPVGKLNAVLAKRQAMQNQQEESNAQLAEIVEQLMSQGIPQEEAIQIAQQQYTGQETAEQPAVF